MTTRLAWTLLLTDGRTAGIEVDAETPEVLLKVTETPLLRLSGLDAGALGMRLMEASRIAGTRRASTADRATAARVRAHSRLVVNAAVATVMIESTGGPPGTAEVHAALDPPGVRRGSSRGRTPDKAMLDACDDVGAER